MTEDSMQKPGSGKRYNSGKNRLDLIPAWAMERVGEVFTKGAEKYDPNNWKNGLSWTGVVASLKRHLSDWEQCKDFDEEDGLLHMAHLATNALFLLEYYNIYPEGDDRWRARVPRIGLDVDDVIADFCGAYSKAHELDAPKFWNWTYFMSKHISDIVEWEDFLGSLPRKINPDDMPFEPVCYITSRSARTEVTELWIEENGFACAPVVTVGPGESKVEVAKANGVEVFVDDNYSTYLEMNAAGICCYLMDAGHNRRYDVGYRRIKNLSDLPWFKNNP